ncbi:MAG: MASE1 domain-containing protein, partial [Oculatellaceae cyanobacterium Prado106]|nr:MASE1 domain-containing protein [Oculatellaceae cyanobacterium Prado106]
MNYSLDLRPQRSLHSLYPMLAIALVYYFMAKLGQYLAIPPGFITPVYAPSGIALAVLLRRGNFLWPGIGAGAVVAASWALWANTGDGAMAIASGVGIAIGSVLQACLGAWLLRRWVGGETLFQNAQNIFKFAGIELWVCMVSPTFGATALLLGGFIAPAEFLNSWTTFWLGDYVGVLVIAPLLLIWGGDWMGNGEEGQQGFSPSLAAPPIPFHFVQAIRQRGLEISAWLVLLGTVSYVAFGTAYPIEYMLVPLLVLALAGAIRGTSSFNRSTLNETLLLLQAFIGAIALTTLTLSAVIVEREQAKAKLEQLNTDLESKIIARTTELSLAKQHLEDQVQERTASLTQALAELTDTHESLKRTQLHLVQTEKMSSLGQLVAGVAHEINNPINFIYGNLTYARAYTNDLLQFINLYQELTPDAHPLMETALQELDLPFIAADLPNLFSSMRSGADRIKQIVLSLRNFSRLDETGIKAVDIHEGIESTLVILEHQLKETGDRPAIQVIKTYGQLPLVHCYAGQLNQVFMNILSNAIDALDTTTKMTCVIPPEKNLDRTEKITETKPTISEAKLLPSLSTQLQPTIHIDTTICDRQ